MFDQTKKVDLPGTKDWMISYLEKAKVTLGQDMGFYVIRVNDWVCAVKEPAGGFFYHQDDPVRGCSRNTFEEWRYMDMYSDDPEENYPFLIQLTPGAQEVWRDFMEKAIRGANLTLA